MEVAIGLDLGTTNCKCLAVQLDGKVVATSSSGYSLHSPHPGWAAQDVNDVWAAAQKNLRDVLEKTKGLEIIGIGLSGAMHSVLPVDSSGSPMAEAMTWADQRASNEVESLRSRIDPHSVYMRTGCPLVSTYNPAKISWWLHESHGIADKVARFVTIKDWIAFQLTGIWATDYSLASSTGILDISSLKWDHEALDLLGIERNYLPELISSDAILGKVSVEASKATGLPKGMPVTAGASDGALASLGSGAFRNNQSVITVGTSGAVRRVTSQPILDPVERTWCYVLLEHLWFAGGAINNGGLALQWIKEKFYSDNPGEPGFQKLMAEAEKIPPGADGVILLPYFTGERSPHWNPTAKAIFCGLSLEHSRGHVGRAVLESVAFCLADVWEALTADSMPDGPVKLTGGITQSSVWAQIVCDTLGVPMEMSEAGDASALGAAMLAVLGAQSSDLAFFDSWFKENKIVLVPDMKMHSTYQNLHKKFQNIYRLHFSSERNQG